MSMLAVVAFEPGRLYFTVRLATVTVQYFQVRAIALHVYVFAMVYLKLTS
jgi:hypothetical protein